MATPDTIYVQFDQDGDTLTFCPTQVNDSDIVYVRADIADAAFASWEKAIQDLRSGLAELLGIKGAE